MAQPASGNNLLRLLQRPISDGNSARLDPRSVEANVMGSRRVYAVQPMTAQYLQPPSLVTSTCTPAQYISGLSARETTVVEPEVSGGEQDHNSSSSKTQKRKRRRESDDSSESDQDDANAAGAGLPDKNPRDHHNSLERKRRGTERLALQKLACELPIYRPGVTMSKAQVLTHTTKFIVEQKTRMEEMEREVQRLRQQAEPRDTQSRFEAEQASTRAGLHMLWNNDYFLCTQINVMSQEVSSISNKLDRLIGMIAPTEPGTVSPHSRSVSPEERE